MSATVQQRRIHSPVQRDAVIFLETSEESGGRRTHIEVELAAGGGNELHKHLTYAERFIATEGEVTVHVDGLEHVLKPGDEATADPGVLHRFSNDTDETVRFQVELTPGHRGMEQVLQIGYGLAEDGLTNDKGIPRNLVHAAVLMNLGEIRVTGPIRLLVPLFHVLAAWGRRRGTDAVLIERYVRY